MQCYDQAEDDLIAQDHLDGITKDQTDCNCLPACSSIVYNAAVSHTPFNWKELVQSFNAPMPEADGYNKICITFGRIRPALIFHNLFLYNRMHTVRLRIIFKDSHFHPKSRQILRTNTEMLAMLGGLLSIFFGASFLSFIELVYYFIRSQQRKFNLRSSSNMRKLSVECDG